MKFLSFLRKLFDDNNTINEKAIIGFLAFILLALAFLVNLVTAWLGNQIVITEFLFDGFMIIVLGAFGIASVDKWINKRDINNQSNKEETPDEPSN